MPPAKKELTFDLQKLFVLSILTILVITLFYFTSAFISTLFVASIIVTAVYPLHRKIQSKIKIPTLSALVSLILIAVVILIPLTFLFFMIVQEATAAYGAIADLVQRLTLDDLNFMPVLVENEWINNLFDWSSQYIPIDSSDIINAGQDFIGKISSTLIGQTTNILKNLTAFIIHIIVFLLSMFYLLKDGERFFKWVRSLLPLSEHYRLELTTKLYNLSYGMIYGIFGAALVQGFLVGAGFYIVGIRNVAFWGSIAALFSPLPYVGTAIIWFPVVISLLIAQKWLLALFLFLWGVLVVSTADNLVKPYLIGSSTALHPLAVLVVLLGGAFAFGIKGLLFGPIILTLTLAFLHIYSLEYKKELKPVKAPKKRGVKKKA